jgi:hypothetical protein
MVRVREIIFAVRIRPLKEKVGSGNAAASTRALISWTHKRRSPPPRKFVTCRIALLNRDQRILKRVIDELGNMFREWLYVLILHNPRCTAQV